MAESASRAMLPCAASLPLMDAHSDMMHATSRDHFEKMPQSMANIDTMTNIGVRSRVRIHFISVSNTHGSHLGLD